MDEECVVAVFSTLYLAQLLPLTKTVAFQTHRIAAPPAHTPPRWFAERKG